MKDEKRLARLRAGKASVSPAELAQVLRDWGFELQSVHGSHHVYRHDNLEGDDSLQEAGEAGLRAPCTGRN